MNALADGACFVVSYEQSWRMSHAAREELTWVGIAHTEKTISGIGGRCETR